MLNRDKEILKSLKDLELTPTMEKNARDKYLALSKYLDENGLDSDFYPQGSFLIGTTVKPYRDGKEHDYDLDVLAVLKRKKDETNAYSVKNDVGDCIKGSGIYCDKLEKEDRNCWTIKYADISSDIGFMLDVVPAVDENGEIKEKIVQSGVEPAKVMKTVAITEKVDNYGWKTSNPLGFGEWFLEISTKHLSSEMIAEQYNDFPFEIRTMYASIEEIPTYFYKSSLQRTIQFIKRHRDIYFDRIKSIADKPSSILLSALAADCVKDESMLSVTEIINKFIYGFQSKSISIMQDSKILNPVDLRENLIEYYSEKRLSLIVNWINSLNQLMNISEEFRFKQNINTDINERVFKDSFKETTIIEPTKPWML